MTLISSADPDRLSAFAEHATLTRLDVDDALTILDRRLGELIERSREQMGAVTISGLVGRCRSAIAEWERRDGWVRDVGDAFAELGATAPALEGFRRVEVDVARDLSIAAFLEPSVRGEPGTGASPSALAASWLDVAAADAATFDADALHYLVEHELDHHLDLAMEDEYRRMVQSDRGFDRRRALDGMWQRLSAAFHHAYADRLVLRVDPADVEDLLFEIALIADDPTAMAELALAIGPRRMAEMPDVIARIAWLDRLDDGRPSVDAPALVRILSEGLAAATHTLDATTGPRLDAGYVAALVEHGTTGGPRGSLVDGFPTLFSAGGFHHDVAVEVAGIALELLRGDGARVSGHASPLYPGFEDVSAVSWQSRPEAMLSVVVRTPTAATELLRASAPADPELLDWLLSGHHDSTPTLGATVNELLVAASVGAAAGAPSAAREVTAHILNASHALGPDRVRVGRGRALGAIFEHWMLEIVSSSSFHATPDVGLAAVADDRLSVPGELRARFVALAMREPETSASILAASALEAERITAAGTTSASDEWAHLLARLWSTVSTARSWVAHEHAGRLDAEAGAFNAQVGLLAGLGDTAVSAAASATGAGVVTVPLVSFLGRQLVDVLAGFLETASDHAGDADALENALRAAVGDAVHVSAAHHYASIHGLDPLPDGTTGCLGVDQASRPRPSRLQHIECWLGETGAVDAVDEIAARAQRILDEFDSRLPAEPRELWNLGD